MRWRRYGRHIQKGIEAFRTLVSQKKPRTHGQCSTDSTSDRVKKVIIPMMEGAMKKIIVLSIVCLLLSFPGLAISAENCAGNINAFFGG